MKFIKKFEDLNLKDISEVGGKNASLGEMIRQLSSKNILIPSGFAIVADAYRYHLKKNNIENEIKGLLKKINKKRLKEFVKIGRKIRSLIIDSSLPSDLADNICKEYKDMEKRYGRLCSVAVRSSATAEDLPEASFAGQQETFLNIRGEKELLKACKECFASLFTDRAISYRIDHGFDHMKVALSVGVQKMVRSDKASAGVAFTLDTESGFKDVVFINSSYGLGENVVKGVVNPDEFYVHKPTLEKGFKPVLKKRLGSKKLKMVYAKNSSKTTKNVKVSHKDQMLFSLDNNDILNIAKQCDIIEKHYTKIKKKWSPMDIEWAKDGIDGKIYIVQARPETVYSLKVKQNFLKEYILEKRSAYENKILFTGKSIGRKIASGKVRVIESARFMNQLKAGEILVTNMTDPDWEPIMKRAKAIVTNSGGRTCFSGDTIILTNKGFLKIKDLFENYKNLYVPSLNRNTLKVEWKKISDCMKRKAKVIKVNVSQTGRMKNNFLNLTEDHKVLTFENRELIEKEINKVIKDKDMLLLMQNMPKLKKTIENNLKLAYLLGAISTDGHVYYTGKKGEVQFIQKPTKEKAKFIKIVCDYMEDVFEKKVSVQVKKESSGSIRGKLVVGSANAYRFYGKQIAKKFLYYQEQLVHMLLTGNEKFILNFLAGVIDGDGTFNKKSGKINIYCSKDYLLQAIMVACLRLGFIPQVVKNRTIFNVQIVENLDKILSFTNRVKGVYKRTRFGTRFFSSRQLLLDLKESVNYKGRIKPFIDKNLLIDVDKIEKYILGLTSGKIKTQLKKILNSDVRMQRVRFESNIGVRNVYNIEVKDNHNYVVFTERYTPILVNNCHAAIVSRELGIPAIVGSKIATEKLKTGDQITVDCSQGETGFIFKEKLPFKVKTIEIKKIPKVKTEIMMNIGNPDEVFNLAKLPVSGIGLARIEFIINTSIKIHPMALIYPEKVKEAETKKQIKDLTFGFKDKKKFFIDKLAQEAGTIAAAFYPKPVIIRMSDFKSNEYRQLIGGQYFEPEEENPMLGFRGASRYYHKNYKDAFELECLAMKKIREEMGFENVKLMIPFVRTVEEGEKVIKEMKHFGLQKHKNKLEIYMMCEIPSNVILIDEFSKIFDGFSIGSNDLTQTVLAVDRDSALISYLFDERNLAVKDMMKMAIKGAKKNKRKIGICGQAPSDYPEISDFLIKCGIDSISLNPDTVLKEIMLLGKK